MILFSSQASEHALPTLMITKSWLQNHMHLIAYDAATDSLESSSHG